MAGHPITTDALPSSGRAAPPPWLSPAGCDKPASTYQGSAALPFQRWYRFKEAFAPRFVAEAVDASPRAVGSVVDPFSGSGTTALTCQFMGVRPWAVEVNPFLADLAEAKLARHDAREVRAALARVLEAPEAGDDDVRALWAAAPATFVEPGVGGRWVFDAGVAREAARLVLACGREPAGPTATLLRVVLGSCLMGASNVAISGKGRRYRGNWRGRVAAGALTTAFRDAAARALADLGGCGERAWPGYDLVRGDAREALVNVGEVDMALTSPPYPNSFDYTDVYNVELWALGYLRCREDNRRLRTSTVRSHVQVHRPYPAPSRDVPSYRAVVAGLRAERDALWNRNIPDMVAGYFGDMERVLEGLRDRVRKGGVVVLVTGDSRYGSTAVPVSSVLADVASEMGYDVLSNRPLRSMRSSPQQGGRHELSEDVLTLRR